MTQTFEVRLTVTVEPETDLEHFQPGLFCATLDGTDWKWVGGPEEAVYRLMDWALRGGYRDQEWPNQRPYTIARVAEEEAEP